MEENEQSRRSNPRDIFETLLANAVVIWFELFMVEYFTRFQTMTELVGF